MPELWDAYTDDFQKAEDITLIRGESIPNGLNHMVCDILVKHDDGTYLITQRHPDKVQGLTWEASCGGSALQEESPEVCALRELYEETGIEPYSIKGIDHSLDPSCHCIFFEFLAFTDCNKSRVRLQKGETIAYRWLTKYELFDFARDNTLAKRTLDCLNKLQIL